MTGKLKCEMNVAQGNRNISEDMVATTAPFIKGRVKLSLRSFFFFFLKASI